MTTLARATALVEALEEVVAATSARLTAAPATDDDQSVPYDITSVSSAVAAARHLVDLGPCGEAEADLALVFAADTAAGLAGRMLGREALWGASGRRSTRSPSTSWPGVPDSAAMVIVGATVISIGTVIA
ncbi:hypothetical protein ABZT43_12645 [Streptomyces sp. NPDC005349]|uniref:hypothetical protein n=1 Tax=Streptomyces sp. NPDC005349 TaxID=3157037 RepID=UPI0033AA5B73